MKGPTMVIDVPMVTTQVVMRPSTVEKDHPTVVTDMMIDSMAAVDLRFDL